jgi:hypothetical protein
MDKNGRNGEAPILPFFVVPQILLYTLHHIKAESVE